MGIFRHNDRWWWPRDRWSFGYGAAGLGFGLLPISVVLLVSGGSFLFAGITAILGVALLAIGLRTY